MADWYPALDPQHIEFIRAQHVFFVATAPGDGYPNLSPKGYDSLEIVGPSELVFVDLPGSGNQTASHVLERGRLTLMFTSFTEKPLILRVYGRGRVLARGSDEFVATRARLRSGMVGPYTRQLIVIEIEKVQTSCGYGVPRYEYAGERPTLIKYYERKVASGELAAMLERSTRRQDPA
jgi:predicted pyridoxine 5'-phosphate oxidase superfamily flavin-nucleotide-binding protein